MNSTPRTRGFVLWGSLSIVSGLGLSAYALRPRYWHARDSDSQTPTNLHNNPFVRGVRSSRLVKHNPGIRLLSMTYLNDPSTIEQALSACISLSETHAISHITPPQAFAFMLQMLQAGNQAWKGDVNMMRMTGRRERADQHVCPWLYAEAFREDALPTPFRAIAHELQHHLSRSSVDVKLRDVTINYRQDGYYRLDPHIDPLDDGDTVCILSLTASAVLTLAPEPLQRFCQLLNAYLPSTFRIERIPFAIDVLVPKGHVLILQGPARYSWTHAIRQGTYLDDHDVMRKQAEEGQSQEMPGSLRKEVSGQRQAEGESRSTLWDTFGKEAIRRCPERWSLVFAFGTTSG